MRKKDQSIQFFVVLEQHHY